MSLLADAAEKLGITEESVYYRAAEWGENYEPATKARWMLDAARSGVLPNLVKDFCIMVLAGRIKCVASRPKKC